MLCVCLICAPPLCILWFGVNEVKGSQACYEGQEAELTLTIVDGGGPTLLGRDWLSRLRLNWAGLNHIAERIAVSYTHSALFAEGLGRIKGVTAQLYLKEGARYLVKLQPKLTGWWFSSLES